MAFDKIKSGLKNVFDLAVHGESTANYKRKPEVVGALVEANIGLGPADDKAYADRLRDVLMQVPTKDLDTLKNSKVGIILDKRLGEQILGARDRAIFAVFYKRTDGNVVGLQDSGKSKKETGYFDTTSHDGAAALSKLADYIRGGGLNGQDDTLFASRYHYSAGMRGGGVTVMEWRLARLFDLGTQNKNPGLNTPPKP